MPGLSDTHGGQAGGAAALSTDTSFVAASVRHNFDVPDTPAMRELTARHERHLASADVVHKASQERRDKIRRDCFRAADKDPAIVANTAERESLERRHGGYSEGVEPAVKARQDELHTEMRELIKPYDQKIKMVETTRRLQNHVEAREWSVMSDAQRAEVEMETVRTPGLSRETKMHLASVSRSRPAMKVLAKDSDSEVRKVARRSSKQLKGIDEYRREGEESLAKRISEAESLYGKRATWFDDR